MRTPRLLAPALFALALASGAPDARATTVLDAPVAEMARRSQVVVQGTVEKVQTAWNDDHTLIVARSRIRVDRVLKGQAGKSVTVRQNRGTLDGVSTGAPGDAKFAPGEEVVVFLEPHPAEDGAYVLIAMGAAKFTIQRTADGVVAERDRDGLSFVRPGADGRLRPAPAESPARLTLDELLREVTPAAQR